MNQDRVLDTLNEILSVTMDGAHGFHVAAGAVRDLPTKCLLARSAARCRASAEVIRELILRHGGVSYSKGTIAGLLHRTFIAVASRLPHVSDAFVLSECLRGQKYAFHAFQSEMNYPLPDDVTAMLQWQLKGLDEHTSCLYRLLDASTVEAKPVETKPAYRVAAAE